MSGEITLSGKILKVGGLKEKIIGAFNQGIKTIYIPNDNKYDLNDVPENIKQSMNIILIQTYHELFIQLFK